MKHSYHYNNCYVYCLNIYFVSSTYGCLLIIKYFHHSYSFLYTPSPICSSIYFVNREVGGGGGGKKIRNLK